MIHIPDIIRQMTADAETMRAMVETITVEQADWKPDANTWSMKDVMAHVYNEERGDFRAHLQEIFAGPPQPWGALQPQWQGVESCRQALEGFLREREASIAWLKALENPDWELKITAEFGPQPEIITLSAGDILVSWVAHDFLHIRQLNELHFAWNEKEAAPYSVQYAGGW